MCVAFVFQGISHLCSCCPSAIHKWGFLFLGNMGEGLLGPGSSECSGDCLACEGYQTSLLTASSWGCWDSVTTRQLLHALPLGRVSGPHRALCTWASAGLCAMHRALLKACCSGCLLNPSGSVSCNSSLSGIGDICVIQKHLLCQTSPVQLESLFYFVSKKKSTII